MIRKTLLPILFTSIAMSSPGLARTEIVTATVSYADLDLASPAGVAAFDRRIAAAIRELCGPYPTDAASNTDVRRCRALAQSSAEPQRQLAINNSGSVRLASNR